MTATAPAHTLRSGLNMPDVVGSTNREGRYQGVGMRGFVGFSRPAPHQFARDVSQDKAHGAATSTARSLDCENSGGGANPPTRKHLFTPGPDDGGAYCHRCQRMILRPCTDWLCPMEQEDFPAVSEPPETPPARGPSPDSRDQKAPK